MQTCELYELYKCSQGQNDPNAYATVENWMATYDGSDGQPVDCCLQWEEFKNLEAIEDGFNW